MLLEIFGLILALIGTIIGVALGGYILFVGRHALQITLAIVGLGVTANMLAVFVADVDNGWDLFEKQAWGLIGIAFAVGVLGFFIGRAKPEFAALAIGFVAGADLALWLYDVATYFIVNVARLSESTALIVGTVLIVVGGLLGYWLVRVAKDEALILITMVLGTTMIQGALDLSRTSSWTAIIVLTLALAGVLVQYALYLREIKGRQLEPEQHASSLAYFQNLELDL